MAKGESFVLMEYNDGERDENDSLDEIVCRWEDKTETAAIPYEKEQDEPQEANIKGLECPAT